MLNYGGFAFILFCLQSMVGSVYGPRGQRVARRVGLVPNQGTDSVITRSLLAEDKTALGTSIRQRVVNLLHVLVSKYNSK